MTTNNKKKKKQKKSASDSAGAGAGPSAASVNPDQARIEKMGEKLMKVALTNLTRDGHVAFMTFCMKPDGSYVPHLPMMSGTPQQKEQFGDFLRAEAASGKYDAIAVIAESWTVDAKNVSQPVTGSISQHPDRKECVMVQMSSRHGELQLMAVYDRAANGRPIRPSSSSISKEWQPHGRGRLQGFFAGV